MINGEIYAFSSLRTSSSSPDSAIRGMEAALDNTGMELKDINYIVGTGYGRVNVPFAHRTITEIACHARGANHVNPAVRTILDMGGQDCKAIRCDEGGKVVEFMMNDKCAAGTGRGVETVADLLEVPIEEIGALSLQVKQEPRPVSSTCVVFARTEILGLLRQGWSKEEVLASFTAALAKRTCSLLERLGVEKEFFISGGIAKNTGVVKRIERRLGVEGVSSPIDPQILGAVGGALFARDLYSKSKS
jgi:bzd-type benzoyl-CoA reductase Q subunit